jgi:hypothetical protein
LRVIGELAPRVALELGVARQEGFLVGDAVGPESLERGAEGVAGRAAEEAAEEAVPQGDGSGRASYRA